MARRRESETAKRNRKEEKCVGCLHTPSFATDSQHLGAWREREREREGGSKRGKVRYKSENELVGKSTDWRHAAAHLLTL